MTVPLLSFEHVSKTYWRGPHQLTVLDNVSLELRAGDFVGVYGQKSAGKTTLLKVAAGFETPDHGTVRFEGADLAGLSRRHLSALHRHDVGWVERSGPMSADLRVLDYVALPLLGTRGQRAADQRAKSALARVGAEECAYETWDRLADAERMLVAIAQALVREPRLLLVDDPTAGLDVLERERIAGLLRTAADESELGILMAVPDMPAMLQAHDVRSLSRGQLLAPASPPPNGRGQVIDFPGERSA
jgi:ABC-type lipoprotein export system ATPase subunit